MKKWFLFLFMASPAISATVPEGAKFEYLTDFSGGLNTADPSHKLTNEFSPYMRNVYVDNNTIEGGDGFAIAGSSFTLLKVTGIFPYVQENGTTKFLVTDSSITLETADFSTWVLVSSVANTGSLLRWFQVRNKMWGANGSDFVRVWDGATLVILNGNPTGSVSTPNVPKFKFGAYYQDRVWGFNAPGAASDLYFTSVITTDNIIISPDDPRAWPDINNLKVGRGDGTIGTALWIYDGQLRAGKERSIYTIYGDLPTNYFPRKEEAQIGVASQDSVVVMDGETHFVGQDGIYRNVRRISDLIEPDFDSFNKDTQKVVRNSWETKPEFNKGQFYGSTVTESGLLTLDDITFTTTPVETGRFYPPPGGTNLDPAGTTFYGPVQIQFSSSVISDYMRFYTKTINYRAQSNLSCTGSPQIKVIVNNLYTGQSIARVSDLSPGNNILEVEMSSQAPVFEGWQIHNTSYSVTWELASKDACTGTADLIFNVNFSSINFTFAPATTGQFLSEVTTVSVVSAWGTLDSERTTNGGSISYYYRTSTSAVNISTQIWSQITPGSVISAPSINNYVQWATTITSVSSFSFMLSQIDNVVIDHIEGGGAVNRPFAIDWKNRYWLAVSTEANEVSSMIYVKSKITNKNPDAWMPFEGINIRCFAKNGETLYGGSSSTGTVYRLDFGTNYNGTAIPRVYDTPDMVSGEPFYDKTLNKILVDGEKVTGGEMGLYYSLNDRDFIDKSFSIDGSGRYSKVITGVADNGNFKTLRMRLFNSQLDTNFLVNNIGYIYSPTSVLTDK